MNKNVQRKLSAYAATTAGAVALAGSADAQVIHVDINPDTAAHDSVYYDLDMNGDAIPELHFTAFDYQTPYGLVNIAEVDVLGDTNNAVMGSLYYGYYPFPFALNNGDSVSGTSPDWQNKTINNGVQYLGVMSAYGNYANWIGVSDKYLGVRFKIGANTHYGWVRISVTADVDSIIIKEYAYQLLPGVGITAGQLVGTGPDAQNDPIRIFASGNTIVLQNTQVEKGGNVRIYNTTGQAVYEGKLTSDNMRIGLDNSAPGIYFIEVVRPDGSRAVRKVYVN